MKALHYDNLSEALVQEENERRLNPNAPLHPIVAVAEDYYDRHLSAGHRPIIYNVCKQRSDDMCQIAYTPGRLKDVLDYLRDTELRIYGCTDFEYTLLEDEWHKLYQKDRQIAVIYSCFALIAVLISCLGLFGISLFDIRQRYREIGIRKINGAGMCDLYQLLFRKYILVLAVAFIIAAPLTYYIIYLYTQDFAVKASVGIGIYVISLLIVALISLGTLFWQIHKAAKINPAEVIKSE